jgi:hypothetical protein
VLKDEMFWQITAAELLGETKAANAVKPLLKVVLSPMKVEAGNTALNALIKIGKPAIAPTVALIRGEDKDLVDYSKLENIKANAPNGKPSEAAQKAAESAHVGTAASILAAIGREEATAPLLEVLGKATDDVTRVLIARELVNLPPSADVTKAFQDAYEKTPASLSTPILGGAREALLDKASWFFDASFVPWLAKTAKDAKGEAQDVDAARQATLIAMLKLAKPDQIALVDELAGTRTADSTVGKAFEKEIKTTKDLVSACGDKVECYLAKLAEPASQAKETKFQGIKSVHMVGVLGGADARGKLVELMPKLTSAETRGLAGVVIDRFSPKGDAAIAKALQKIVDDAEASKDGDKKAISSSLKQVIYRLNARAQ